MKRNLQRALFLPANRTVLFDTENLRVNDMEHTVEEKYYKNFIYRIFKKMSTRVVPDPAAYSGNNLLYNSIWKALYLINEINVITILYPEPDSDITPHELKERFEFMRSRNLAHHLMEDNQISNFEAVIEKFDINPFNSNFLASNSVLLDAFCDRYYPRSGFDGCGSTFGHTYHFKTSYWNTEFPKGGLKYCFGRLDWVTIDIYQMRTSIDYTLYSGEFRPFLANKIIYLEEEFNPDANRLMLENHNEFAEFAQAKGYELIYLPKYMNSLGFTALLNDSLQYFYPLLKVDIQQLSEFIALNLGTVDWNAHLLTILNLPALRSPALVVVPDRIHEINPQQLSTFWFEDDFENRIFKFFKAMAPAGSLPQVMYHLRPGDNKPKSADETFFDEGNKLAADVLAKIETLKSMGMQTLVAEIALRLIGNLDDQSVKALGISSKTEVIKMLDQPVSRLRVEWTSKYDVEISLPEYGNMVVDMPRLPKAVFLLFLNHPEGIKFCDLDQHEAELLQLYSRISNLADSSEMRANVARLVDPMDNSINVNCSRIKSAFVKLIDDKLAKNYYITGWRGDPRVISIDRNLVEIVDRWA